MKLSKNRRGISLIVLVITIIIMIILAGAIILSLNSSGIIEKANKAKTDSDNANLLQAANVASAEWNLKYKLKETNESATTYIKNKLKLQGFTDNQMEKLLITNSGEVSISKYIIYTDSNKKIAPIPDGFIPSIYEGEKLISEGLVIYETDSLDGIAQETAMTTYNQYVWIPVEGTFERVSWNDNQDIETSFVEPITADTANVTDINNYLDEISQYNVMKTSVETNGGFYIARYEAGKEVVGGIDTAISKKGAAVWNKVAFDSTWEFDWDTWQQISGIPYGDTEYGCAKIAKKSYTNAERHLIFGIEWDAALQFIAKDYPDYPETIYTGNYTGSVKPAGYMQKNNIYDMAGNVKEWTYELCTYDCNGIRVLRGGDCKRSDGTTFSSPSTRRDGTGLDTSSEVIGFRFALCLN